MKELLRIAWWRRHLGSGAAGLLVIISVLPTREKRFVAITFCINSSEHLVCP